MIVSVLGFCDSVSVLGLRFCFELFVSVLGFVILFCVLLFCFEVCDSGLSFAILFWILGFCFRVL